MFPNTPIFLWTLQSSKKLIVHQGGTYSGKTYSILMALIIWAIENRKLEDGSGVSKNLTIRVYVTNVSKSLNGGAFSDFIEIFDRWELWDYLQGGKERGYRRKSNKFIFKSGCVLSFVSSGSKSSQESRDGKSGIVYFNDLNMVDKEFYNEIKIRTERKIIVDFNSDNRFYIHDDIDYDRCLEMRKGVCLSKKPSKDWSIDYFITNYRHCIEVEPFLDKEGNWIKKRNIISDEKILEIEGYKTKYEETGNVYYLNKWRVLGLGLTGGVDGLIYPQVKWISDSEFNIAWQRGTNKGFGLDYGFAKVFEDGQKGDPCAFTKNVIYKGAVYSKLLFYEWGLRREELAERFMLHDAYDYPIIMDRSAALEVFVYLEEVGFYMKRSIKPAHSVITKINRLRSYDLYFVEDKNLKSEQEKYKWTKINGEYTTKRNPPKGNDHALDSIKDWLQDTLSTIDNTDYEYPEVIGI